MFLACFSSAAATASRQPGSGGASTTGSGTAAFAAAFDVAFAAADFPVATFLTAVFFLLAGVDVVFVARASVSEAPVGIVLLMSSLRVLIPAAQIAERVHAMGAQIDRESGPGPIVLVGTLKGSFIFLADLARAMHSPVRIDFVGASSYGGGSYSSGDVRITKDLDSSIEGCDVIVVEDIVDTGTTLAYLLEVLALRKPKSLRVAAILDKPSRRTKKVQADYVGFEIPDEFVVGYGLDYAQDYRHLPDVCVFTE
jgi:hypoxanthine phosphoribosyltransferase